MQEDPLKLWQHVHGATAHFPIAMMIVSMLFDVGAILFRSKEDFSKSLRTVGFWTLIIGALACFPTVLSGLVGGQGWLGVEKFEAESAMKHRNIALIGSSIILILALWRVARRDRFKGAEFAIYILLLLAAVTAIGFTGYLGAYVARGY